MNTMDPEEKDPLATEEETEETSGEDKTSEEKNGESADGTKDDKEGEEKPKRSDIIQKKKYRERAQRAEQSVAELKTELASLKEMIKKPTDDAERKAQEYIRAQARQVFEELQKATKSKEDAETRDMEERIEAILEVNPDVTEEELEDIMEEYEVEPETALKIFKKQSKTAKPKPKMPQQKRGTGGSEAPKKPDDSKKSLWQIAQEEARKFTSNE